MFFNGSFISGRNWEACWSKHTQQQRRLQLNLKFYNNENILSLKLLNKIPLLATTFSTLLFVGFFLTGSFHDDIHILSLWWNLPLVLLVIKDHRSYNSYFNTLRYCLGFFSLFLFWKHPFFIAHISYFRNFFLLGVFIFKTLGFYEIFYYQLTFLTLTNLQLLIECHLTVSVALSDLTFDHILSPLMSSR